MAGFGAAVVFVVHPLTVLALEAAGAGCLSANAIRCSLPPEVLIVFLRGHPISSNIATRDDTEALHHRNTRPKPGFISK